MKNQFHSPVAMVRIARAPTRFLPTPAFRWAALLALAPLAFGPQLAQAAVTEAWVQRYNNVVSNSVDQAFKVVSDAAGDVIVTGTSNNGITGDDTLTIKYSGIDGSVLWQRRYNSPANRDEVVTGLEVDGQGNVVITGTSASSFQFQHGDFYTVAYAAADGATLWEHLRPEVFTWWTGFLPSLIAVDITGNVLVSIPTFKEEGIDYYTAKYAVGSGSLLWERIYDSPSHGQDWINTLAVDQKGNVFVSGRSDLTNGISERYIVKYSAGGAVAWEQRSVQSEDNFWSSPKSAVLDGEGNMVVLADFYNGNNVHFEIAKYAAADGALLWKKPYDGGDGSPLPAISLDTNGNIVVTGGVTTAKFTAADGALLWQKPVTSGPGGYDTRAVTIDRSGDVVVAGTSYNNTPGYYTAKYAGADGRLIWEKRYDGPGKYDGSDDARSLTVDPSGNVIVTGTSDNAYYTAKYSGADAALTWEARHNGPANRNDYATGVAVDAGGDVVVTGISEEENGRPHYTAKYAAADGALLWEKRGPGVYGSAVALDVSGNVVTSSGERTAKYAAANGSLLWEQRSKNYFAVCVALDKIGNAVTTGYIRSANRDDYYTAKYAAVDGSLLWEMLYSSPGEDQPAALAIDSKGNVVVTGHSNGQFYTAKYSAADGTLIWEKRYSRSSYDVARAVAVDGDDNVVVTGKSFIRDLAGSGPAYDYYTAKYAADNGVLVWEKSYDGPGKGNDEATGMAVDSKGNAVVIGYSEGDLYMAKYAAGDGALLWGKRQPFLYAYAVRVDSNDNFVVAGASWSSDGRSDFYTADFASADGAVLWERRYNGPANSDDYASSLAIGPHGIIAVTGSSDGNFGPWRGDGGSSDFVTIVYREDLSAVAIERVPSGIRLNFTGVVGQTYSIQRSPNVTGPWTTLKTQIAPPSGLIQYDDSASALKASFYRTTQP